MCHLEVNDAIIESRNVPPDDIIKQPILSTVCINSGASIMVDEMVKLESCRLLSSDVHK